MRLSVPLLLALVSTAGAGDRAVDYARDVKPIFQERCYSCHGALKQKAKLRLDSGELIRKGGSTGPAIVPGKSAESILIERVTDPDDGTRMPPELKPLTADQINTLKAWIDQGAAFPADDKPEPDPRDHWAFRAPVRPPVPAVEHGLGHEPDRRVPRRRVAEARPEAAAVRPTSGCLLAPRLPRPHRPAADPPSRWTRSSRTRSADAYEKVVDQLLDSPQYGERWGRHWMDIWRY